MPERHNHPTPPVRAAGLRPSTLGVVVITAATLLLQDLVVNVAEIP